MNKYTKETVAEVLFLTTFDGENSKIMTGAQVLAEYGSRTSYVGKLKDHTVESDLLEYGYCTPTSRSVPVIAEISKLVVNGKGYDSFEAAFQKHKEPYAFAVRINDGGRKSSIKMEMRDLLPFFEEFLEGMEQECVAHRREQQIMEETYKEYSDAVEAVRKATQPVASDDGARNERRQMGIQA